MEFPVISMKLLEDDKHGKEEMTKLALACEQWACFQLIDHGIPKETMDAIGDSLKAFLELPPEAKEKETDTKQIHKNPVYDNKGAPLLSNLEFGYNKNGVAVFPIEKPCSEPPEEQEHPATLQLIEHGIPKETMDAVGESLKAFFELPPEDKEKEPDTKLVRKKPVYDNKGLPLLSTHKLGYNNNGVAVFPIEKPCDEPPQEQEHSSWIEHLLLPCRPAVDSSTGIWPEKPDGLKEKIECYVKEMERVAEKILRILAINVGLERDAFVNSFGGRESVSVMMLVNCILPCPPGVAALTGPRHRDGIGLTMLQVIDGRQGFQVFKDEKWWSVPWVNPYSLVINTGDLMQVISNDRYKSVVHRGINLDPMRRVSISFAYTPNVLTKIGPLSDLIDEQHPCLYGEGRHADFLQNARMKPVGSLEYFRSLKS